MGHKLVAVIDTNLFISGLFGQNSITAQLQELWITQKFQLSTSIEIMKEMSRVLQYPRIKKHLIADEETIKRFFSATPGKQRAGLGEDAKSFPAATVRPFYSG